MKMFGIVGKKARVQNVVITDASNNVIEAMATATD